MKHRFVIVGGNFLLSFLLFSYLGWNSFGQSSSPDERINDVFSHRYAREYSAIALPEGMESAYLRPRSTILNGDAIVPESFLGLPLFYGTIARYVGTWIIPFLTPIFSSLAVVCLYCVGERLHSKMIGMLLSFALMTQPVFLYYSNRGLFHNATFVSLFIISVTCVIFGLLGRKTPLLFFAGVTLGLSLAFRTSEAPWVFTSHLLLFFFLRIPTKREALAMVSGILLVLIPFLSATRILQQSTSAGGYAVPALSGAEGAMTTFRELLFPQGINVEKSIGEFRKYAISSFPFAFFFVTLGAVLALKTFLVKTWEAHWTWRDVCKTILVFGIPVWLILFYGSRTIRENAWDQASSIGSSYLRYWLPLFVFSVPLFVVGVTRITTLFARWKRLIIGIIFLFHGAIAYHTVFLNDDYGLFSLREHLIDSKKQLQRITKLVPKDSMIVSGRFDKMIFPQYPVLYRFPFGDIFQQSLFQDAVTEGRVRMLLIESLPETEEEIRRMKDAGYYLADPVKIDHAIILATLRCGSCIVTKDR